MVLLLAYVTVYTYVLLLSNIRMLRGLSIQQTFGQWFAPLGSISDGLWFTRDRECPQGSLGALGAGWNHAVLFVPSVVSINLVMPTHFT